MSASESEPQPPPRRRGSGNAPRDGATSRSSGVNTVSDRPGRALKPSEKRATSEKENYDAAQRRLLAAQKAMENAKKKFNKAKSNAGVVEDVDNEYESEERDDDDAPAFASAIISVGRLPPPPTPPPAPIRKIKKSLYTQTPRISVNAFKNLPEANMSQQLGNDDSPLSPAHSTAYMDIDGDEDGAALPPPPPPRQPPVSTATNKDDNRADTTGQKRRRSETVSAAATAQASTNTTGSDPSAKRAKTKIKLREPKLREGFVQAPGARPKAADYEPLVEALIIRACAEYSARILTINAFPSTSLQLQWAKECWENAGYTADDSEKKRGPRYVLTDRVAKMITKRGSQIRGKVVDSFRPLFASHYKLQRSAVKSIIAANKLKVEELLNDSAFHYKNTESYIGYGENPIIPAARNHIIFKNKTSLAAIFRSMFNPVPPSYVSLDFAVLEHLMREWETGVPITKAFTEKDNVDSYRRHLIDVNEWCDDNPEVTTKIRAKWYKRATQTFADATASVPSNVSAARREANRAELAGRTGETDSEDGAEEDEDDPFLPTPDPSSSAPAA